MERVPKSKFRPRALEYLRRVENTRKALIITDHGIPVLKITPYEGALGRKAAKPERLRGTLIRYDHPFEPVETKDWNALK